MQLKHPEGQHLTILRFNMKVLTKVLYIRVFNRNVLPLDLFEWLDKKKIMYNETLPSETFYSLDSCFLLVPSNLIGVLMSSEEEWTVN